MLDTGSALFILYLAYSAFCPPASLSSWSCQWCQHTSVPLTAVQSFGHYEDGTYGYVGLNGTSLIVSFRGTNNLENWLANDLDAPLVEMYPHALPGLLVHRGFLRGYRFMELEIKTAIQRILATHPVEHIVCTGHSLGAALATLAALDLPLQFSRPAALVTYGSPRVGNSVFARILGDSLLLSWRVTHRDDIVPHLPFQWMGYAHTSQEFWFWNRSEPLLYRVCSPSDGEDPSCADSVSALHWVPSDHMTYLGIYNAPCAN